jgi:hypothetical protein
VSTQILVSLAKALGANLVVLDQAIDTTDGPGFTMWTRPGRRFGTHPTTVKRTVAKP